jgi:ATP-dependent Zn protease
MGIPKTKRLTITAYHEAGHAVVGHILRRRFKYVTIDPDAEQETFGHLSWVRYKSMEQWQPDLYPERYRSRFERMIMMSLAGVVAEGLITGHHEWRYAHRDRRGRVLFFPYFALRMT